jgi:hypothetical protein
MIARHLGADVGPLPDGRIEFGFYEIRPMHGAEDFLPGPMTVTQSHFHQFGTLPEGPSAGGKRPVPQPGVSRWRRRSIGMQFHPEAKPAALFRALAGSLSRPLRPPRLPEGGAGRPCRGGAGAAGALVRGAAHDVLPPARPERASTPRVRRSAASCISKSMLGRTRGVVGALSPSGGASRRNRATCNGV